MVVEMYAILVVPYVPPVWVCMDEINARMRLCDRESSTPRSGLNISVIEEESMSSRRGIDRPDSHTWISIASNDVSARLPRDPISETTAFLEEVCDCLARVDGFMKAAPLPHDAISCGLAAVGGRMF